MQSGWLGCCGGWPDADAATGVAGGRAGRHAPGEAHIQQTLGRPPCDGTAYAFRNRRGSRLKLLQWEGTGVWLSQRRLHQGRFRWPSADDRLFTLTQAQWQ